MNTRIPSIVDNTAFTDALDAYGAAVATFERSPSENDNPEAETRAETTRTLRRALVIVIDAHCLAAHRPALQAIKRIADNRLYNEAMGQSTDAISLFIQQDEKGNPALYKAHEDAWCAALRTVEAAIDAHVAANVAVVIQGIAVDRFQADAPSLDKSPQAISSSLSTWLKERLDGTPFEELLLAFGNAASDLYQSPDEPIMGKPDRQAFLADYSLSGQALENLVLAFGARCYAEGQSGAQTRKSKAA